MIYSFTIRLDDFIQTTKGSFIDVTFPNNYNGILPASPSCTNSDNIPVTCNIQSNTIRIANYFESEPYDRTFAFKITNIKNPSKTGSTDSFTAMIRRPDLSIQASVGGAFLIITEGQGISIQSFFQF